LLYDELDREKWSNKDHFSPLHAYKEFIVRCDDVGGCRSIDEVNRP